LALRDTNSNSLVLAVPTLATPAAQLRCHQRLYQLFFASGRFPSSINVRVVNTAQAVAHAYSQDLGMSGFTGVVLDMGHQSARAVPFLNGKLCHDGVQYSAHLGGRAFDLTAKSGLQWATCCRPSRGSFSQSVGVVDLTESLFSKNFFACFDNSGVQSVQDLIQEAVLACESSSHAAWVSHIVLSGGLCHCDGFKSRLVHELKQLPWSFTDTPSRLGAHVQVWSARSPEFAALTGLQVLMELSQLKLPCYTSEDFTRQGALELARGDLAFM
jgi:actin-related protein